MCPLHAEHKHLPPHSTSSKSKKRKSLVISNPIPCNTAFPADHVSIHSSADNTKDAPSSPPAKLSQSISEGADLPEENNDSSRDVNSSDSDLSSSGSNTPKRQSACDNDNGDGSSGSPEEAEEGVGPGAEPQEEEEEGEEAELATNQSDDSGVGVLKSDAAVQEVASDSAEGDPPQDPEQERGAAPPSEGARTKPAPVPAPRNSFRSTEGGPLMSAKRQETSEEESAADSGEDSSSINPPGLLYKVQLNILEDI